MSRHPLAVTLPYTAGLLVTDTTTLSEVIPMIGETGALTVTLPNTDDESITDTLTITSELVILTDTQVGIDAHDLLNYNPR